MMEDYNMSKTEVKVAIGLLFSHGRVLVGWRDKQQHQGNKNEFPGGKIEHHETPISACKREIFEEVGIEVDEWFAWDEIYHEYDDIIVRLYLFYSFIPDQLLGSIQDPWTWYSRSDLTSLNFPKANDIILDRLLWPQYIKISHECMDVYHLPSDRIVYLRDANFDEINDLEEIYLNKIIVNIEIAKNLDLDKQKKLNAIHIKQSQLASLTKKDLVMGCRYIAACHDLESISMAQRIGCEAIFISPVQKTNTHINAQPLGWSNFQSLTKVTHALVFALGGLTPNDLKTAQDFQAYGVAGVSAF